jgi:hypothetical protein
MKNDFTQAAVKTHKPTCAVHETRKATPVIPISWERFRNNVEVLLLGAIRRYGWDLEGCLGNDDEHDPRLVTTALRWRAIDAAERYFPEKMNGETWECGSFHDTSRFLCHAHNDLEYLYDAGWCDYYMDWCMGDDVIEDLRIDERHEDEPGWSELSNNEKVEKHVDKLRREIWGYWAALNATRLTIGLGYDEYVEVAKYAWSDDGVGYHTRRDMVERMSKAQRRAYNEQASLLLD